MLANQSIERTATRMQSHHTPLVSAGCEVHRNHGPKGVHGAVSLEFQKASEFKFVSLAVWPGGENYDAVVEAAVFEALREVRPFATYSCCLVSVRWHASDSCATGFTAAARHATLAAFGEVA